MSRLVPWLALPAVAFALAHARPGDAPKASPPAPADEVPKAALVAKGDAYLVHVVPATPSTKDRPGRPMMVTHTRRDTGDMTVLAESDGAPQFNPAVDLTRQSFRHRGVAGVRADDERLYVLTTYREFFATMAAGVVMDKTTAELRVFWLADGSPVGKWPVEKFELPLLAPAPQTEAGPLRAALDGVVVHGQAFVFGGKKLRGRTSDTPTDAAAPAVLASAAGYRVVAVSALPPAVGLPGVRDRGAGGVSLLYVPLPDAMPKTLLQTGDRVSRPADGTEATFTQTRVVDTSWDAERLYVLVWHGQWERPGRDMALPRDERVLVAGDDYRLYVFWLADGSDLTPVALTPEKPVGKVPAEAVRGGLMRAVPNGVEVFGRTVTFKGKERERGK